MDDEIETLVVGIRPDTGAFASDAASMRAALEASLGSGADKAGGLIERGLAKAVRSGKLGFDDLKRTALSVFGEIAAQSVTAGLGAIAGGSGGGLVSLGSKLIGAALGLPGRATGGPVSPGRAYMVGERGPEMFVPTASGSIAPGAAAGSMRDVRVAITLMAPGGGEPEALRRSGRQVARAVADAIARSER